MGEEPRSRVASAAKPNLFELQGDPSGFNAAGPGDAEDGPLEVLQPPLTGYQAASEASPIRAFEPQGHMHAVGTSAPDPGRHGRGRKYIEPGDHALFKQEEVAAGQPFPEDMYHNGRQIGRRNIPVVDTVKAHLRTPLQEHECTKPPSNVDMKESVKEWMTTVHSLVVFDESAWAEVELKRKGLHWVVEAIDPRAKTLSREGPSARAIAEKLSMMPVLELRHFGVRFAGMNNIGNIGASKEPERRTKATPGEHNPTMVSFGVHASMNREDRAPQGSAISSQRKEARGSRYIASGRDNFAACAQPSGDSAGHARDTDFASGIERGIGHGKRHIGTQDSMQGVLYGR